MSAISPIRNANASAAPAALGGNAKAVRDAMKTALPTLFNNSAAEQRMLSQLQKRPPAEFATGNDQKGSLKLTYNVDNPKDAASIAKSLAGKYDAEDESWVGDNLSMPKGTQLANFQVTSSGKQVRVTIDWAPES